LKIVLFETLIESHIRSSLGRSLRALGHTVVEPEPVWRGLKFPELDEDVARVDAALDEALAQAPDVLLNFRPSALLSRMVRKIRSGGTLAVVWLSDDPVLYGANYRFVVDDYDIVLNCGAAQILEFYEKHHGIRGVNFPFWTDQISFPKRSADEKPEFDVIFNGNCFGGVRSGRYDLIASLPGSKRIYGQVDADPQGIAAGYLRDTTQLAQAIAKARLGLNIPQFFSHYAGDPLDFPGLARLGSFQFPSRVIQYAAVGLPIIGFGLRRPPEEFPEMQMAHDVKALRELVRASLSDQEKLDELGEQTHRRFLRAFNSDARADFLVYLLENQGRWRALDAYARARLFSHFKDEARLPTAHTQGPEANEPPTLEQTRDAARRLTLEAPTKWRFLFLGTALNGPTDIVACLLRALRNTGQHVTFIDVWRRREYLKERPKRWGGFGPHFVNAELLREAARATGTQIIVCVGGGLCFSADDAEMLRRDGLLLIGLTLSDPDVQPSVIDHVGQFDLHFTNSRLALDTYRDKGVHNTQHLPFAIDRSWLLADGHPDPQFDVDIICLGHASGRIERLETMERVAEAFTSVRTYGRGWTLPGSMPVRGVELLKASRGGLIHINFPRTRAGYTNVKVGVFESVGSGAVLCTEYFEEMEDYFAYDEEIVGFHNTDDLMQKLTWLLGDTEERERIRRRAFARLVKEHLYEHRWLTVLDSVAQEIYGDHRILGPERAAELAPQFQGQREPTIRVLVTGFYGHGNLGDELILKAIEQRARAIRPELQLAIATNATAAAETLHHMEAVDLGNPNALAETVAGCDAVVLGGGGLWNDSSYAKSGGIKSLFNGSRWSLAGYSRPGLTARAQGLPFHVFGMGAGPLTDPDARQFVRFVGEQATSLVVRDRGSQDVLKEIEGWTVPIGIAPDPVYALSLEQEEPWDPSFAEGLPMLVVNLRPWAAGGEYWLDRISHALDHFLESTPHALMGWPVQRGEAVDEAALRGLFERLQAKVPTGIFPWTVETGRIRGLLSHASAVLAMRLHACLLAHRMGLPVLGLAYAPKVTAHFAEIGRPHFALPLDAATDDYRTALSAFGSPESALDASTRQRIGALEQESQTALEALVQRLPSVPSPRRHIRIEDPRESATTTSSQPDPRAPVPSVARDPWPRHTLARALEAVPGSELIVGGAFVRVASESEIGEADLTLTETPRWLLVAGTPGAEYRFTFHTRVMPGEEPSTALILFKIPGDSKKKRTEFGVLSKTVGRYRFLPHGGRRGIVTLKIKIPDSGIMKIGFRSWKNKHPVKLSSRFSVVPS
jgi:polysaccharide pyruvyl transferase CsaB